MDTSLLAFQELVQLMARLRGPAGCPWDKKQTWHSLVPHTIEEAYEVAEAVETDNVQGVRDELGDLLFHIIFYSQIAQEENLFSLEDLIRAVISKMTRRHPHVFAPQEAQRPEAEEVPGRWEKIKRDEKAQQKRAEGDESATSVFDDIHSRLPALLWAAKVQRKMGQLGFDWQDADGVLEKVREEMAELDQARHAQNLTAMEEEFGDLLFTLVNLARHIGVNPETALRHATHTFQKRFRTIETRLHTSGQSLEKATLAQLESLWQEVKSAPSKI